MSYLILNATFKNLSDSTAFKKDSMIIISCLDTIDFVNCVLCMKFLKPLLLISSELLFIGYRRQNY